MQIRDTDLDTLESVVGIVAFGDLEGEDTCNLTDLNFLRIFRISQLTAEYLLHVQDHLARENAQLKVKLPVSVVRSAMETVFCVHAPGVEFSQNSMDGQQCYSITPACQVVTSPDMDTAQMHPYNKRCI